MGLRPGSAVSWMLIGAATTLALLASVNLAFPRLSAQEKAALQAFSIRAHKYAFEPARLEVQQDDLVKVTLRAEDIAHSFSIDAYRIAKRAGAGQAVTFEFRADQPGTFPFYCDLRTDDGCRKMRGELIVRPR